MNYIADFLCKKLRLVIEVDGGSHQHEETYLKDRIKQETLEKAGFRVIRFRDEQVLKGIENVRRAIEQCVEEREKEFGLTSPVPPHGGGHSSNPFTEQVRSPRILLREGDQGGG